jgi:hypothetical protein
MRIVRLKLLISLLLVIQPSCTLIPMRLLPVVEDPVFSIATGTFDTTFDVSISTSTDGAEIIYTTDGSSPNSRNGTWYNKPLTIDRTTNIKALAIRDNFRDSLIVSAQYHVVGEIEIYQASTHLKNGTGLYSITTSDLSTDYEVVFSILNSGVSNLAIESVSLDSSSDPWDIDQPDNSVIPPGYTTNFIVSFYPLEYGESVATVTVENDDTDDGTYTFTIEGTAWNAGASNAEIDLYQGTSPVTSGVSSIDFGTLATTIPSSEIEFTIENNGTTQLIMTSSPFIEISGTHSGYFSIRQPQTSLIEVGSSLTFGVTWNPLEAGTNTATIRIPCNDSDEDPFLFTLTGFCTDVVPPVAGPPSTLFFDNVKKNQVRVNWNRGSDNSGLTPEYRVYYSLNPDIATPAECLANGTGFGDWALNKRKIKVTSLEQGTLYYFTTLIRDSAGNMVAYEMDSQSTTD